MVSTFYPPYNFGGDGMHIYRLSNELAARGHFVDVFHCEDSYLLLNKTIPSGEYPNHPNVSVTGLKSGAGYLSPLATQQTGKPFFKSKLVRALEQNEYDVIHYNNMSLMGISTLSLGSAVKLYTLHEHWLICPMHVLWKYDREVCSSRSCFRCQLRGKRPPQLWRFTGLLERMVKNIDCFLSPSRFTLNKHLEAGLEIPIRHMPYFLPTPADAQPSTTPSDLTARRPYFLFVGRLERIKGLQTIIPFFKAQDKYDLLVAGDGEYKGALVEQAAGSPNIKFLGRLDQTRLGELYKSAIAVVVPSICYETFGIIIIEAFSRKTPVIVNDLGALPEVVEDSGGGFVYRTEPEFELAINKLAADPSLRDKLGTNGYEAFTKYWNDEAHLTHYLELVDELLATRATSPSQELRSGVLASAT